ncbi:regulation of nuclear pre-mRNA domain-containing protein 2 [Condylostylus longicornis]|uniref:regulation of nuclear pre-mRNA domain-containing protein 2 n=1 Tax=Condylostylus longicornis TaxID=2530218 RepID=UPI00244E04DD|nr:regulation of nuclear pre-mRNA domain-containing protein 2 [Condylostylus longicornis]
MDSEFDAEAFEKKLTTLKDTQDGIQQMSSWCLQRRIHHKKIVSCWLNVFKQVRVEHRLILFYLANDVIQNSKRKHYEFVDSWVTALQKATTMVRDEKVRDKICRIFNIWLQRDIYSEEYLSDLKGLLNIKKHSSSSHSQNNQTRIHSQSHQHDNNKSSSNKIDINNDFQSSTLIKRVNDCVKYGAETDRTFKKLPRSNKSYLDSIKSNMIKDKSHSEDIEKDIEQYVIALEAYIKSLKTEIKSRNCLLRSIEEAKDFYGNQREEVKVVVNAYKNFGLRIKSVKKKLDDVMPNLPSPIVSPDINAPSPEPDADIALPDDDNTLNLNLLSAGGSTSYVSYMDGNLPFDINDFKSESSTNKQIISQLDLNAQAIEVISTRKEEKTQRIDYELNTFSSPISKLYSNDYNQPVNTFNAPAPFALNVTQQSSSILPKSTLIPPPPIPPMLNDHSLEFPVDWNSSWNTSNNTFNNIIDTPVSPPHFEKEGNNLRVVEYDEELDNMALFSEDIDNRNLSIIKDKNRLIDVDHRNLISLTGSPGLSNSKAEEFANSFLNDADDLFQQKDVDYRTQGFNNSIKNSEGNIMPLKPPTSLIEIEQTCAESELPITSLSQANNEQGFLISPPTSVGGKCDENRGGNNDITINIQKDNTESVDMDVSDDDIENYIKDVDKQNISKKEHQNNISNLCDIPIESNDEQIDFQMQYGDVDCQNDIQSQLDQTEANNCLWDNNWKQHQMNPSIRMNHPPPQHNMIPKQRFNSPRYRGNIPGGPRSQSFQNKFYNSPANSIMKSHRGSPFYFNRGGSGQRGNPIQQRGGTTLGFQRGNFRGRPW